MQFPFKHVAIIGMGLMGTSLSLALKNLKSRPVITAITHTQQKVSQLNTLHCADRVVIDLQEGIKDADCIVLASTLDSFKLIARKIVNSITKPNIVVIDLGSVKDSVIREIGPIFSRHMQYIPCHPMAGSEKSGYKAAHKNLYQNTTCIITPRKINSMAFNKVKKFWKILECHILILDPQQHDRNVAHLSHIPHVISVALVNSLDKISLKAAGPGWESSTRLAKSSGEMWSQILLYNQEMVLQSLDRFTIEIQKFRKLIAKKDKKGIIASFERARKILRG